MVFDTVAYQFSLIDLPTPLKTEDVWTYKFDQTRDEKFCIVDIKEETLVSWFMTTNDDSVVERWMVYKRFPLQPIVKELTRCSIEGKACHVQVDLVAVIDGFVYLSIFYCKDKEYSELYLSICLETLEISELFNGVHRDNAEAHPYVMAWPPSLLQSKVSSCLCVKFFFQCLVCRCSNLLESIGLLRFCEKLILVLILGLGTVTSPICINHS